MYSLKLTLSQQTTIKHQFDCFCKKVLREEYRDCIEQRLRYAENEILFCEMSPSDMAKLYTFDNYFFDNQVFNVLGLDLEVQNLKIAEALSKLPKQTRDIILLSYFLDMTDKEIGICLNILQRTVQRRRTSTLEQLEEIMEGKR